MAKTLFTLALFFVISNAFPSRICINETTSSQHISTDTLQKKVLAELHLNESDIKQELFVSKDLPYAKHLTVMVITKFNNAENTYELDAYIVIVNNKTGSIVQKYYEPKAWISDAMALADIEIDTAPYTLSKDVTAFGLRLNYTGSSRPFPYEETELSLYISDKSELIKVLSNYSISLFKGEWDTNCIGEFKNTESVIIVDKKHKTNNFTNLIINQKHSARQNFVDNGDCKDKTIKEKDTTITLRFNGTEFK
jgi:hypothetical protein